MLLNPIAAPNALKTNCVPIAITKPEKIGPHRTRSWYSMTEFTTTGSVTTLSAGLFT
jgi:hypothetical protein